MTGDVHIDLPTMLAEVLEFFHLGWDGTVNLDFAWFCKLYNRIPMIQARRLLAWIPVIAYPHLQEDVRTSMHEHLMAQSGLERLRQESLAAERYESGWSQLRGLVTQEKKV